MFPGELPWDCPIAFRMGRTPATFLSDTEKSDVLAFIQFHEGIGSALSICQIEQALALMKMEKQGLLGDLSKADLEQSLEANLSKYQHLWRDFKTWVQKNRPASEHLSVSKLHQLYTCCRPKGVWWLGGPLPSDWNHEGWDSLARAVWPPLCSGWKGFQF